jgi:FAD/FMN-containing dehydrogenase
VAARLRAHASRGGGRPVSFRKRAVSHQVPKRGDKRHTDDKIDVSDLDAILAIDPVARTCTAEPGVTFVDLVDATLRYGLVPTVVPELETITIGGAVSGCSLESTSFRHGGFHDACLEYEVVTARGDVLVVHPGDLVFEMMHGAFGTLGLLSKLTFRLVPAKPFVRVRYETHATLGDYQRAIASHYRGQGEQHVDFMDGIIHAPDCWVLSLGTFVDPAPYTHAYKIKPYYRTTRERTEDYFRTRDYLFRYDRGVTSVHPIGSSWLLRLADKLHALLPGEHGFPVTLDTFIPFSRAADFFAWYERTIGHYPLWCVPYKRVKDYAWIADGWLPGDALFLDVAIYGMKQPEGRNVYVEVEEELRRIRGIKTLISYNYYDEDVFWTIWNRPNYLAAKAITDPDGVFRDLWAKTCRAARGLA